MNRFHPKSSAEETSDETEQLWSSSSDDILGCPKCARKLKVPYDREACESKMSLPVKQYLKRGPIEGISW